MLGTPQPINHLGAYVMELDMHASQRMVVSVGCLYIFMMFRNFAVNSSSWGVACKALHLGLGLGQIKHGLP